MREGCQPLECTRAQINLIVHLTNPAHKCNMHIDANLSVFKKRQYPGGYAYRKRVHMGRHMCPGN